MTQPDDAVPDDTVPGPTEAPEPGARAVAEPEAAGRSQGAAGAEQTDRAGTEDDAARPAPSRSRPWVVIISGGALGTLGAMISAAQLLSALDGRSSGGANLALLTLIFSIVIGGLVASIGFKALGVRAGWRSALLGALVAVVGYFAPFLLGAVLT